MPTNTHGGKTEQQKLGDLVDWFVMDRGITIEFSYNEKRNGKIIPEYDVWFFQNGRRITERGVCMQMLTEFFARNFRFSIAQIMSALNARVWQHYVDNFEPPEWLAALAVPVKEKRPPGRPRKYVRVAIPDPDDDDYEELSAVNS